MKNTRHFLLLVALLVMGCYDFLIGKTLSTDNNPCIFCIQQHEISSDSLGMMSMKYYMVPYVKYLTDANLDIEADYSYTLVFIDDDDIPEMIVRPDLDAYDMIVLTQNNNAVNAETMATGEMSFVERHGLFKNFITNMEGSEDVVYQLKKGKFEMVANMRAIEDPFSMDSDVVYLFNDSVMDENAAERLLKQAFEDKGTIISLYDKEWIRWKELLNHKNEIEGWK